VHYWEGWLILGLVSKHVPEGLLFAMNIKHIARLWTTRCGGSEELRSAEAAAAMFLFSSAFQNRSHYLPSVP
jgi:hypothetical protein